MRATVLRDFTLAVDDDFPEPELSECEVLVKTLACGVCGSDLHFVQHARALWEARQGQPPRPDDTFAVDLQRDVVLGHEFCAEIVAHGPGCAAKLPVGTRVCAIPLGAADGMPRSIGFSNELPGGYGEFMKIQESLLLPVPEELGNEIASLTEPMAVGRHAVERGRLEDGTVPLVIGCGPIGLAVIAVLKMQGYGPILASDFSPARRQMAIDLGADVVIDPSQGSPYEALLGSSLTQQAADKVFDFFPDFPKLRPTAIFECVGVPGVIDEIFQGAPRHARVIVVGVCMEPDTLRPGAAINKELSVEFVLGYTPEEFAETLQDLASGRLRGDAMITGKVGVDGVAAAFEALRSPDEHAKIIVEPWRRGDVEAVAGGGPVEDG